MRRYSDFRDLKKVMHWLTPGCAVRGVRFPRKHFTGCRGRKLEARRRALEAWLRSALAHPASGGRWSGLLKSFLLRGCFTVADDEPADSEVGSLASPVSLRPRAESASS